MADRSMGNQTVIPDDSALGARLNALASEQRIVCFAGLPGVGKSLLVRDFALRVHRAGRQVHLLQWDVTRGAFETPDILRRYPEVDGVTHEGIRLGLGLWAREAVLAWHRRYPAPDHVLVGEVALIGNRLLALAEPCADDVEPLLAGPDTLFVVPVPSAHLRTTIESIRERTIVSPQHHREASDAPPNVMRVLWRDLQLLAHDLGLTRRPSEPTAPYDPDLYGAVYAHLLRHRRARIEQIDTLLPVAGSVYEIDHVASELTATPDEVQRTMEEVERRLTMRARGEIT